MRWHSTSWAASSCRSPKARCQRLSDHCAAGLRGRRLSPEQLDHRDHRADRFPPEPSLRRGGKTARAGLLESEPGPPDRRRTLVRTTPALKEIPRPRSRSRTSSPRNWLRKARRGSATRSPRSTCSLDLLIPEVRRRRELHRPPPRRATAPSKSSPTDTTNGTSKGARAMLFFFFRGRYGPLVRAVSRRRARRLRHRRLGVARAHPRRRAHRVGRRHRHRPHDRQGPEHRGGQRSGQPRQVRS